MNSLLQNHLGQLFELLLAINSCNVYILLNQLYIKLANQINKFSELKFISKSYSFIIYFAS
jgi:hypothetical protein